MKKNVRGFTLVGCTKGTKLQRCTKVTTTHLGLRCDVQKYYTLRNRVDFPSKQRKLLSTQLVERYLSAE